MNTHEKRHSHRTSPDRTNFRGISLIIYLLFSAFSLTSAADEHAQRPNEVEKPPYYLSVGEQKLVRIPGLKRYSLGGDSARVLGSKAIPTKSDKNASEIILLKGVKPGPSDLWSWDLDGTAEHRLIRVIQPPREILKPELASALSELQEVEIYYFGNLVTLRGEIRSNSEAARVQAIESSFPKETLNESVASVELVEENQKRIEKWLATSLLSKKLTLIRQDRTLTLMLASNEGLEGPIQKTQIERRARGIYPLIQIELNTLADSNPTVHFNVFLLELKKSKFHTLGLGWPASQDGAFQVTSSQISDLLQLNLTLNTLEGEGSLRILSNPELVVRAPGEAELFSGGEIPIEAHSAYFSSVTWKSFGLMLKLNVTQAAGDRVRLDITTEVSHLDPTLASNKVPGLQANRMKTQVDAPYEHPLLLSGLLQQSLRKEAKGLPLLREIPILGALFGSEDYLNEKTELVAILVPTIHIPTQAHPYSRDPKSLRGYLPKGALPPAREPNNPALEQSQEMDPDFPWNVL